VSRTTSLPEGIRAHRSGSLEARYGGKSLGTFSDLDAAVVARANAKMDAKAGRRVRRGTTSDPSLHDATQKAKDRIAKARAAGTIRQGTFDQKVKELRPWERGGWQAIDGDGFVICDARLSQLRAGDVVDWFETRRIAAPSFARKELFALKATLRDSAIMFGAQFDMGILSISPGKRNQRTGRALRVEVLDHFAAAFPDRLQRLPLIVGTVGMRIGEALGLRRDQVDLAYGTIFVPAAGCKEGRDKTIPLTPEEIDLLRDQLASHDSDFVFPRPRGGAYSHWSFWGKVWQPARELAAASWAAAGGAASVFDDLRPHDLRHTAATLMRRAGFDPELAALRLGHADAGWLLMTVYNHPEVDELQQQMQQVVGRGIRASLVPPTPISVASAATASPSPGDAVVIPLRRKSSEGRPVQNARTPIARPAARGSR
jgi:integrase